MHLFRYFIFALLVSIQISVFAMDQASSSQTIVCASLPEEVWKQIFVWVNYSLEKRRSSDTYPGKDVPYTFEAIKNIIPYTRVCKAMHSASTSLITSYIQLAEDHLKGEDKHSSLRWAIKAYCYPEHKAFHYIVNLALT